MTKSKQLYDEIVALYSHIEAIIADSEFCAKHPDIDFTLYKMLGELKLAEIICNQMASKKLNHLISKRVAELKQQLATITSD